MLIGLFLESGWRLLLILVAVQFGLIAIWSWRRTRFAARAVWIGFAAAPLLLLLSVLVVTPREQVIQVCHTLAAAVDRGKVAVIGSLLAGDFQAEGLDRDAFLDRVEKSLTRHQLDDVRLRGFEVSIKEPHRAVATFDATCRVRSPDIYFDRLLSRWRLTFRESAGRWRVTRVEVLPTPQSPISHLRDWGP